MKQKYSSGHMKDFSRLLPMWVHTLKKVHCTELVDIDIGFLEIMNSIPGLGKRATL